MKYLITYNESIRDAMIPKSESDIRKELEKLPAGKVFHTAVLNGVNINDIFSKEEIAGLKLRIKREFQEDRKELKEEIVRINQEYKGDITESMEDNDYEIQLDFPGCMKIFVRKEMDNVYFECGYELVPLVGQTSRVVSDWDEPETLKSCISCVQSWLNIYWFQSTNESIRDKMTPKTKDDIRGEFTRYGTDRKANEKLVRGAKEGLIWLVEEAIEEGGDVNVQNDIALREASVYGHLEMVKFLLSKGANVKPYHYEAERWAIQQGHDEIAKILVQARKKIESVYKGKLSEGVRDMMTPKSPKELAKIFDNMREDELSIKEVQGMQSIMLSDSVTNNPDMFVKTGIDCHLIFREDGERTWNRLYYISTSEKSLDFGIPPRIEGLYLSNGKLQFYVDISNKFLCRVIRSEVEILLTYQNDYRDKIEDWHNITMREGIDDVIPGYPSEITLETFNRWIGLLQDMFNSASKYYIKTIEYGVHIPELR